MREKETESFVPENIKRLYDFFKTVPQLSKNGLLERVGSGIRYRAGYLSGKNKSVYVEHWTNGMRHSIQVALVTEIRQGEDYVLLVSEHYAGGYNEDGLEVKSLQDDLFGQIDTNYFLLLDPEEVDENVDYSQMEAPPELASLQSYYFDFFEKNPVMKMTEMLNVLGKIDDTTEQIEIDPLAYLPIDYHKLETLKLD